MTDDDTDFSDADDDIEQDEYERVLVATVKCTGKEGFQPAAPKGWWQVASYNSDRPSPLDIASWFHTLNHVQYLSEQAGQRLHKLVRDEYGNRVLLVHPDLGCEADDVIETLNCTLVHCNCGGYDCLHSDIQVKGARTFAKRNWPHLPLPKRLELIEEHYDNSGETIGYELLVNPSVLDSIEDAQLLHRIYETPWDDQAELQV